MIKFESTEVIGWEHAIRGMRNPLNSWGKSDSAPAISYNHNGCLTPDAEEYLIGSNDFELMKRLRNAGTDHRKFMRMITVYVDITAPLYWWKEFDTYKVGTVANSCSTMHKIAAKEFTLEDFSCEHLNCMGISTLGNVIDILNVARTLYLNGGNYKEEEYTPKDKRIWWQMIQLLPSSYNQKRTISFNYEVLSNMYKSRKNHKLDEWSIGFCDWIKTLPYSELITGDFTEKN